MSKVILSEKQNEIVVFDKGSLLVKAAAGSGKPGCSLNVYADWHKNQT